MIHVPYRRHGRPNSLSHFIKILVGVRLGFRFCQFNVVRHDDGQVRGFGSVVVWVVPIYFVVTRLVTDVTLYIIIAAKNALSHKIKFTPTGLTTQSLFTHKSYTLLPLILLRQLFMFVRVFFSQIGCVIMAFVGRTRKKKNSQVSHVVWYKWRAHSLQILFCAVTFVFWRQHQSVQPLKGR